MKNDINFEEFKAEIAQATIPSMEEKTQQFIDHIDRSHALIESHAKREPFTGGYEWLNQKPERFDYVNEEAIKNPRFSHMKTEASYSGPVGFLGKGKVAILKSAMAVAIAFAAGAGVASYAASEPELNETPIELENPYADDELWQEHAQQQKLKAAYEEAGITPTASELEAGMTPEQIEASRAIAAEENEEYKAMIEASRQQDIQHNQEVEDAINQNFGRSK